MRDSTLPLFRASSRKQGLGRAAAPLVVADDIDIAKAAAVSLLFSPGERPTARAIRTLAQSSPDFSISLDPQSSALQSSGAQAGEPGRAAITPAESLASGQFARATGPAGDSPAAKAETKIWLELLASGLTFDLSGLAPGAGDPVPQRAHMYGLAPDMAEDHLEAITLTPGPHLLGGGAMLPVVRCLAWLGACLAVLPETRAVAWHSARCWSSPQYFRDVMLRWMEGGAFPGFGLAALIPMADGGLQSEGLSLFIGQELRIEPELVADRSAGAKIALRLMHLLVENGRMQQVERITLPGNDKLRLEPSANGRFVRVWRD